jgi:hypothetical protein
MVREARFAFDNPDDYQHSDLDNRHLDSLDLDENIDWIKDLKKSQAKKRRNGKPSKSNSRSNPQQTNSERKHLAGADWLDNAWK